MKLPEEVRVGLVLLTAILLLSAVIAVLVWLDVHVAVGQLIEQLRGWGMWGALGLIGIQAVVVVLLLPGVFFTVGAGFFFGPVVGTLCIVVGTTLGASGAFLIGRHVLGGSAERYISSAPRLKALNDEFTGDGWKLVLITRFIPFFPFKLSNYFFGLSGFRFRGFVFATALGVIPISATNAVMGALAADVTEVTSGSLSRSPTAWAVDAAGLAILIVTCVLLTRRARRALARAQQDHDQSPASA